MEFTEKVSQLEIAGFNWFEIAEILDSTYDEVREVSYTINER